MAAKLQAWLEQARTLIQRRWVWIAAACVMVALVSVSVWFLRLAGAPARFVGSEVSLAKYGLEGITIQIVYPTRLGLDEDADSPGAITVLAVADSEASIQAFDVVFPLDSQALVFVDGEGRFVPGRIWVVPGHPDAMPYELGVAHGQTQLQGRQFRPYTVSVTPLVRHDGQSWPVPELAFNIRLESRWERAYRWLGEAFSNVILPYLMVGLLAMAAVALWQRYQRKQRQAHERTLAQSYVRLGEHIKLENWQAARKEIESIRLRDSGYRDVQSLDTMVSAAETADWRREQLYGIGIKAYKRRDWPTAVQAFRGIEQETPYYRDVRFLRRTSALYADLASRDRSLRIDAAHQLGEVADLVDMAPLLNAMGDSAPGVRNQAQDAFRAIGRAAYDTLIGGLAHQNQRVVDGATALLAEAGQSCRENLLGALRSTDPRITSRVAPLLARLGARRELAGALLWASAAHLEGLVTALLEEGSSVTGVLIETLVEAPPDRRATVVAAMAALKTQEDVSGRIHEAYRATKVPKERALLQRVLDAQPEPFKADIAAPHRSVTPRSKHAAAGAETQARDEKTHPKRLRLLDRRRS